MEHGNKRGMLEHSVVIEGHIVGLSTQQILARNELMKKHGLSYADANAAVRGQKSLKELGVTIGAAAN